MLFGALLLPWQVITAEEVPAGPAVGGAGHPEDSPARPSEALVGGQAVIEGVMMRAPHSYCVAVRKPKGEIQAQTAKIVRPSERNRIWGWPILRGLGTLGQAMVLGLRALRFSADVALEEDGKPAEKEAAGGPPKRISNWWMALNLVISIGFFVGLYKFVPLAAATWVGDRIPALHGWLGLNLVDGLLRIFLFLGFVASLSLAREIRRVFSYHGAEHQVVFNYESGQPVAVESARRFPRFHPRCGTSFLLTVMVIAMLLYMLIPFSTFAPRLIARIALLPVIAGLSYEIIRLAARRQGFFWTVVAAPGLWTQRLTTRRPDDRQLQVAIHALCGAMEWERRQGFQPVIG